jgi:hypothetical protein
MTDIARPQTDRDRSCEAATTSMQAGHSLKFNPTPFDVRPATAIDGRPMRIEDERDQVQTSD